MPTVTIEVTPDIAAKIRLMAEAGVFALATGNATLNFHNGLLKSVKTEQFTYPQKEALDFTQITPILIAKTA